MPDYTPQHSIAYPLPGDRIKDASVAAKLASDIRSTAVTADAAITTEGQRVETAAKKYTDDTVRDELSSLVKQVSVGIYEIGA